jgi:predicted ATPase
MFTAVGQASPTAVFFDRGVADPLAYGRWFGVDERAHRKAAQTYRYNQVVFFAPRWQEMYHQDEERRMTFEEASRFGDEVRSIYEELGYSVTEIPRGCRWKERDLFWTLCPGSGKKGREPSVGPDRVPRR